MLWPWPNPAKGRGASVKQARSLVSGWTPSRGRFVTCVSRPGSAPVYCEVALPPAGEARELAHVLGRSVLGLCSGSFSGNPWHSRERTRGSKGWFQI